MSIDALFWAAHEIRVNGPHSKLVLLMMANDADVDGVAIVEPHTFASSCCLSLPDLKTAMRDLLDRGLIERVDDPRVRQQTRLAYRLQGIDP